MLPASRRSLIVTCLSLTLLAVLGIADYLSGIELDISIFYFIPAYLAIWYAEKYFASTTLVACATTIVLADLMVQNHPYANPAIPYWNAAAHLGLFLLIVAVLRRLKRDSEELRASLEHRERAERELIRSNAELEQFAHVAAHDLRSPLVTVGGYVQLLRQAQNGDETAEALWDRALAGVRRMERLIDDLLAYSRVGADRHATAPADCRAVLDGVLAALQPELEATAASVICGPLPVVVGHEGEIAQLFQNLLCNAIRFRGVAPLVIEVAARREQDRWVFLVRDNGIGMEPDQTERIFQMFERLPTPSRVPGTGIGLAICKKIVERHGGRIWAESTPGDGTTFFFSLPASNSC